MKLILWKILNKLRQLEWALSPTRIRFLSICLPFWIKDKLAMRYYRRLSEADLKKRRRSDTVFIFGSGYSLHDISISEWRQIEKYDTMSFNWFIRQNFVRVDFHLIREIYYDDFDRVGWKSALTEYGRLIEQNILFQDTVFIVQGEYRALNGNRMIALKLLPRGAAVYRFFNKSRSVYETPTKSLSKGLVHGAGTLISMVNLAYCLGWKNIVLVGVDLYDRRYFWLGKDETRINDKIRQASHEQKHNTADRIISFLGQWGKLMEAEGVRLSVFNPKSLLTEVLPVFDWQDIQPGNSGQV